MQCFAAGTPILTPDGFKQIEDFQTGDLVLARRDDDPNAPVEAKVVHRVFSGAGELVAVVVNGYRIRTTRLHPFWVQGQGWVPAAKLEVGMRLSSADGQWVCVEALEDEGEYETVYNLRVCDYQTYFVGEPDWGFSVWAHNVYSGLRAGLSDHELNTLGQAYIDNLASRVAAGRAKADWSQIEGAAGRSLSRSERAAVRKFVEHPDGLAPDLQARGLEIQVSNPDGGKGKLETRQLTGRWTNALVNQGGSVRSGGGTARYARREVEVLTPMGANRVDAVVEMNRGPAAGKKLFIQTVTMQAESGGRFVVHPSQELPQAMAIARYAEAIGEPFEVILIPKKGHGGQFFRWANGAFESFQAPQNGKDLIAAVT